MIVVTGCAGFIGSNLVDRLLATGSEVIGVDNLSTGQARFLEAASAHPQFRFLRGDLLDKDFLNNALKGASAVVHLAANADVRFGTEHPARDLEQNTIGTFNVLEAMRHNDVKRIVFSSTGSVYGEAATIPTPEDAPFPVQTSLYGASKLAGEGLIAAYCEGFGFQACIFRFVSILGERYSHGHVFDFYAQLRRDPSRLRVLGNGRQRKSYLYVQDCVDALLLALQRERAGVSIYNLGVDAFCEVNDSIRCICRTLGIEPAIEYSGGERGWIGDNPFIFLDTAKMRALGWAPKHSIEQGIVKTVEFLRANEWIYDSRK